MSGKKKNEEVFNLVQRLKDCLCFSMRWICRKCYSIRILIVYNLLSWPIAVSDVNSNWKNARSFKMHQESLRVVNWQDCVNQSWSILVYGCQRFKSTMTFRSKTPTCRSCDHLHKIDLEAALQHSKSFRLLQAAKNNVTCDSKQIHKFGWGIGTNRFVTSNRSASLSYFGAHLVAYFLRLASLAICATSYSAYFMVVAFVGWSWSQRFWRRHSSWLLHSCSWARWTQVLKTWCDFIWRLLISRNRQRRFPFQNNLRNWTTRKLPLIYFSVFKIVIQQKLTKLP